MLLLTVLLFACTPAPDTDSDAAPVADTDACEAATTGSHPVLVTDIDETLTTSDGEFLKQLGDAAYDPAMRPDANALMSAWYAHGYRIVYLTARGDALTLPDGRSARQATTDWLAAHEFPFIEADVYLSEGIGALGGAAAEYKTEVLTGLQSGGETFAYAYGNADSDVTAYKNAGIPDDHHFLAGALAGEYGVIGIPDDQAYTAHLQTWPAAAPCAR
jgi:phosphatidate phosphatase PAH1